MAGPVNSLSRKVKDPRSDPQHSAEEQNKMGWWWLYPGSQPWAGRGRTAPLARQPGESVSPGPPSPGL